MNCPYCGKKLSKVESLLASFEDHYFCPYCWHDITDYKREERISLSKNTMKMKGNENGQKSKSIRHMR